MGLGLGFGLGLGLGFGLGLGLGFGFGLGFGLGPKRVGDLEDEARDKRLLLRVGRPARHAEAEHRELDVYLGSKQ